VHSVSAKKTVAQLTISFLEHLLDRAYEHVAASVVCFATKNGATAEVAARAAMEVSTNVRYILAGDSNARLLAWLRAFLEQDRKQINNWERALSNHTGNGGSSGQIRRRRLVLKQREEFVKSLEQQYISIEKAPGDEIWPAI
jgi:hypothetical protein